MDILEIGSQLQIYLKWLFHIHFTLGYYTVLLNYTLHHYSSAGNVYHDLGNIANF